VEQSKDGRFETAADLKAGKKLLVLLVVLDENILMKVISGCQALQLAAEVGGFGLTSLEAQAAGKPVASISAWRHNRNSNRWCYRVVI